MDGKNSKMSINFYIKRMFKRKEKNGKILVCAVDLNLPATSTCNMLQTGLLGQYIYFFFFSESQHKHPFGNKRPFGCST